MIKIAPTRKQAHGRVPTRAERDRTAKSFAALLRPDQGSHTAPRTAPGFGPASRDRPFEDRADEQRLRLSPSGAVAQDSPEGEERGNLEDDRRLDPLARHLANPVGMPVFVQPPEATSGLPERMELARAQTLEQMLPALVRKAAWHIAADRRSATLRLEIGSGQFDGTTVLIRADLHEVHIELDTPPGIDLEAWKSRLRLRLASQGLTAMIS